MEKPLSYILMLSLEEIALRRVGVILWNEPDILALIGNYRFKPARFGEYHRVWRKTVESKVAEKLSKLVLPESLKKQILRPIGSQILRWKKFHEEYLSDSRENLDVPILEQLCWTSTGTVDYRKTAQELIRCDVVDIEKRYKLACLYCLEDYIPVFWKELPEEIKRKFYNKEDTSQIERPDLQFCWPFILTGELSKLDYMPGRRLYGDPTTFHRFAFEYSALHGNKAAAEYFFLKLTDREKENSLTRTACAAAAVQYTGISAFLDDFPMMKVPDVLCYLLSLMNHNQHMQIFKARPCEVLLCFLDWPWQDLFLKIADLIWTFLPATDNGYILVRLTRTIQSSGYYFPKLFQELFLRNPCHFRRDFVHRECLYGFYFPEFFDVQDSETIKVIFRNLNAAQRVRLVSTKQVFKLFYNFILRGRWHMVEVCLREATLSEENKERLMASFMEFLTKIDKGQIKWRKRKWRRFFQFLDETDARAPNKRSSEDETLTKAKKVCCEE